MFKLDKGRDIRLFLILRQFYRRGSCCGTGMSAFNGLSSASRDRLRTMAKPSFGIKGNTRINRQRRQHRQNLFKNTQPANFDWSNIFRFDDTDVLLMQFLKNLTPVFFLCRHQFTVQRFANCSPAWRPPDFGFAHQPVFVRPARQPRLKNSSRFLAEIDRKFKRSSRWFLFWASSTTRRLNASQPIDETLRPVKLKISLESFGILRTRFADRFS